MCVWLYLEYVYRCYQGLDMDYGQSVVGVIRSFMGVGLGFGYCGRVVSFFI